MADNRKLHVTVLRLAAVLLILVLLSGSLAAGRFARYVSTVTASDSVKVAKFEVNATSTLLTANVAIGIVPGGTEETTLVVENASEVAISYTVAVDNPDENSSYEHFPLSFQIKVGETPFALPFTARLNPGESATYALVTTWNGAADSSYSGKVDLLEITVSATQID